MEAPTPTVFMVWLRAWTGLYWIIVWCTSKVVFAFNETLRCDVISRSGGGLMDLRVLSLGTGWRWVVSFTSRPSSLHSLNRDPGVGQGALERETSLVFVGNGITTSWTSSPSPGPGLRLGARRVTFWGPTITGCHSTKFSSPGNLAAGICVPLT